eukprot:13443573-Ditylum_brightwellii.AAC.1
MVLKVISLANISSGDGSYILSQALQPQTWTTSSVVVTWPNSKAQRTDWETWRQLIKDGSSSTLTLQQPLGQWTDFLHNKSEWRFNPTTEIYMDCTKRDSGIFIQRSDCNQLVKEPPSITQDWEHFQTTHKRPKYLLPHLQ